jgi:hypothetical protein
MLARADAGECVAGKRLELAMSENERKEAEALESLPELETACEHCRGKRTECYRCGGTGYIPTEFGEKVLALILHHISLDPGSVSRRG